MSKEEVLEAAKKLRADVMGRIVSRAKGHEEVERLMDLAKEQGNEEEVGDVLQIVAFKS